jgi:hypothetical protein
MNTREGDEWIAAIRAAPESEQAAQSRLRFGAGFAAAERELLATENGHDFPNNAKPGSAEYAGYEEAAYIFTQK